jgi:mannitol operon repressor
MTPKSRKKKQEKKAAREGTEKQSLDLQGFLTEFNSESDRATAILGAAMLDEKLRQLLEAFFVEDDGQVRLLLEDEGAPIGAFGVRIRLSYCLGADDRAKLVLIKDIRNRFAHQLHGLSFDSPGVAAQCERLKGLLDYHPPQVASLYDSPRKVYLMTVGSLSLALWAYVASTESKGRRKVPKVETLVDRRAKPPGEAE